MKLRLSMAMVVTAFFAVGCDKKAETPTPAPVEAAQTAPATPAAPVEVLARAGETATKAVDPAKAGGGHACGGGDHAHAHAAVEPAKAAGDHACGGGDHAHAHAAAQPAKAAGDHACGGGDQAHAHGQAGTPDSDCPFNDPNAKAAVAPVGDKPAEQAMGCGGKPLVEAAAIQGGGIHYGKTFELADKSPLGKVAAGATDGQELNVRITGTIDKVCQKKGCWMVVKDGDFEARVIMKDAAFTVPFDATGKPAQVEGTLKVKVYSEAQAKHLAEDGGQDPATVKGEKKEFLLTATAVEIGG